MNTTGDPQDPKQSKISVNDQMVSKIRLKRWQSIGLASFLTAAVICLLKYLGDVAKEPLLMAPFAASLSLIFAVTHSPFVRTKNLLGGYLIGGATGLLFSHLFGSNIWTISIACGLTLLLMEITRTLHPPAMAIPILIITEHSGWFFLCNPLMVGVVIITVCAHLHRRFIRRFPITMA